MSVHAGLENLTRAVGSSTRNEAWRVPGWNSYTEVEISLSCMGWLMMDSFSPSLNRIVPRTSTPKAWSCEIEVSHIGKGGRKYISVKEKEYIG